MYAEASVPLKLVELSVVIPMICNLLLNYCHNTKREALAVLCILIVGWPLLSLIRWVSGDISQHEGPVVLLLGK